MTVELIRHDDGFIRRERNIQGYIPDHGDFLRYLSPHKCRCDLCVRANREREVYLRKTRKERLHALTPPHGTYACYTGWHCRCELCTEAQLEYQRANYAKKNARRRGLPRKPPTPEQRERKNAQQRAKRLAAKQAQLGSSVNSGGTASEKMPELRSRG